METTKKRELRSVLDLAASAALLAVLNRLFGCPIRLVTGVSCAGCGTTRAWLSVGCGALAVPEKAAPKIFEGMYVRDDRCFPHRVCI